jgi:hypothetical protein
VECSKWEEKAALLEEENRELLAKLASLQETKANPKNLELDRLLREKGCIWGLDESVN